MFAAKEDAPVLSVPFEKLPKETVKELNEPATRDFVSNILVEQISQLNSDAVTKLVRVLESTSRHRLVHRSIAYYQLPNTESVLEAYMSACRSIETLTRVRFNERINAAIVAYSLQKHLNRDLNQYITAGLLSETASDDILKKVGRMKSGQNTKSVPESRQPNITGNEMISGRLKNASRRAFGVAPSKHVQLSDAELSRHREKMQRFRSERSSRQSAGMTMQEALQKIEERVLSR